METGTNERKELMLVEQALIYLRECHTHQFSLTRTVVTLNVVTLAATGVFLKAMNDNAVNDIKDIGVFLFTFGILVALFGVVFNHGASSTHTQLNETITSLIKYLNDVFHDTHGHNEFYHQVMTEKTGRVYILTKIFFAVCSIIWLCLGVMIFSLGI